MTKNIILDTDSYKQSHYLQYPPNTEAVSSYIEPRYTSARVGNTKEVVNFGVQMFIKEYLMTPITRENIEEAAEVCAAHGVPFNREGWEYILERYDGKLPVTIEALPEGMVFPIGTPQVQIVNNDPKTYWLTSFLETALLRAVWYPSTVATLSREVKKIINGFLEETADNTEGLAFKLHDFGSRGATTKEAAGVGGVAHLVNFMGTDTMESLMYARRYYGADMAGFSIPAAEHSTISSWGGPEEEVKAFDNMIEQFSSEGSLYAVVSDTYDIFRACEELWGEQLREKVIERGGMLVVRPDSGDPVTVTLKVIETLGNKFGYTVNSKGYKVLNSVRVIQGDGVTLATIREILTNYKENGWSADNIAFGMGAGLLQKLDRDTLGYAMKANAIRVAGEGWKDVYKNPVTDAKKSSKAGRQTVRRENGQFLVTKKLSEARTATEVLRPVYNNGTLVEDVDFDTVRERAGL